MIYLPASERVIKKHPALPVSYEFYMYGDEQLDLIPGHVVFFGEIEKADNEMFYKAGPEHVHADQVEVIVQITGTSVQIINGEELTLKPGDAAVITPGDTHSNYQLPGEANRTMVFNINVPGLESNLTPEMAAAQKMLFGR